MKLLLFLEVILLVTARVHFGKALPVESASSASQDQTEDDDVVEITYLKPASETQEGQDLPSSEETDDYDWHEEDKEDSDSDALVLVPILAPSQSEDQNGMEDEEEAVIVEKRSADQMQTAEYHGHVLVSQDEDEEEAKTGTVKHLEDSEENYEYENYHEHQDYDEDDYRRHRRSVEDGQGMRTANPDLISGNEQNPTEEGTTESDEDDVVVVEACDEMRRAYNCGGKMERAKSPECAVYREKCPEEATEGNFVETFISCGGGFLC